MTTEQQKERKRLIAELLVACESLADGFDEEFPGESRCAIKDVNKAYRKVVEHSGRMEVET